MRCKARNPLRYVQVFEWMCIGIGVVCSVSSAWRAIFIHVYGVAVQWCAGVFSLTVGESNVTYSRTFLSIRNVESSPRFVWWLVDDGPGSAWSIGVVDMAAHNVGTAYGYTTLRVVAWPVLAVSLSLVSVHAYMTKSVRHRGGRVARA